MNRAVWDLTTDALKPFPSEKPPTPHASSGVEVPPGSYAVTVKMGDHEAKGTVQVVPDPRSRNTEADWRARADAGKRALALSEALAEAVERIRNARADVDAVVAKVRAGSRPAKPGMPSPIRWSNPPAS